MIFVDIYSFYLVYIKNLHVFNTSIWENTNVGGYFFKENGGNMHIFWFKFTNEHAILKYFAFLPPPPKVSGGTGNVITPVCVHAHMCMYFCTR